MQFSLEAALGVVREGVVLAGEPGGNDAPARWVTQDLAPSDGFVPRRPPKDFTIPEALPPKGQVEFIRLIRSDRLLRIMGAKIELPETFVHEYVTAVLDIHREELDVIHRSRRVKRVRFRL